MLAMDVAGADRCERRRGDGDRSAGRVLRTSFYCGADRTGPRADRTVPAAQSLPPVPVTVTRHLLNL